MPISFISDCCVCYILPLLSSLCSRDCDRIVKAEQSCQNRVIHDKLYDSYRIGTKPIRIEGLNRFWGVIGRFINESSNTIWFSMNRMNRAIFCGLENKEPKIYLGWFPLKEIRSIYYSWICSTVPSSLLYLCCFYPPAAWFLRLLQPRQGRLCYVCSTMLLLPPRLALPLSVLAVSICWKLKPFHHSNERRKEQQPNCRSSGSFCLLAAARKKKSSSRILFFHLPSPVTHFILYFFLPTLHMSTLSSIYLFSFSFSHDLGGPTAESLMDLYLVFLISVGPT